MASRSTGNGYCGRATVRRAASGCRRIERVESGEPSLAKIVRGFRYRVWLPPAACAEDLEERIGDFLSSTSCIVEREGKGKGKVSRKDVRPYVEGISLDRETGTLEMTLLFADGRTARPAEILGHALGLDDEVVRSLRIVKVQTILEKGETGRAREKNAGETR